MTALEVFDSMISDKDALEELERQYLILTDSGNISKEALAIGKAIEVLKENLSKEAFIEAYNMFIAN